MTSTVQLLIEADWADLSSDSEEYDEPSSGEVCFTEAEILQGLHQKTQEQKHSNGSTKLQASTNYQRTTATQQSKINEVLACSVSELEKNQSTWVPLNKIESQMVNKAQNSYYKRQPVGRSDFGSKQTAKNNQGSLSLAEASSNNRQNSSSNAQVDVLFP